MNETEIKDIKDYEISFLLRTPEAIGAVDKILTTAKAEVFERGSVKDIRLSYPIKKQELAYFGFYCFRALPEVLQKIREELILENGVLRFLIITPPVKKSEAGFFSRPDKKPIAHAPLPQPQVLSNEALEEKLEEILK